MQIKKRIFIGNVKMVISRKALFSSVFSRKAFLSPVFFMSIFLLAPLTASAQLTREQWSDSLRVLSRQIDYNIDSVDLHLKKAAVNIELDQWEYALKEYNDILQGQPYNPAALFYRAYVYDHLRKYPMARVDYEKLLKMFPRHFEARVGLTLVNQKDGKKRDAYDQANRLVEIFPDSAVAYVVRADIEAEQGYNDLAIEDMTTALLKSPSPDAEPEYYVRRAEYYLRNKNKEMAKRDLDKAVELGYNRAALTEMYKRLRKLSK